MKLNKREINTAVAAIQFLLDSMTDDGSDEKAIDLGFIEEVNLLKKMRKDGI